MKCPTCGNGEHRVLRTAEQDGRIRRTRECLRCTKRWFTVEAPEPLYEQAAEMLEIGRRLREIAGE